MADQSSRAVGNKAEELACRYLVEKGYVIKDRNFTIRGGEIDIVAQKGEILVFVEVKARYNHNYGLPQESITYFKLRSLQKTALFYIQKAHWGDKPYRFDLVAIDYAFSFKKPTIEIIENITS